MAHRGRALRKRYGRAKSTGMTPEQRDVISAALGHYGARLADGDFIARGDKVLGVRVDVHKGRLRMLSRDDSLLASFPAFRLASGVADFVEKFWFWKPVGGT